MNLSASHPLNIGLTAKSALVRSLRGERTAPLPVWFMRQAGRSLPEYREIRLGTTMLESCLDPDMVFEITMQPVRRHQTDAAILFSDIVISIYHSVTSRFVKITADDQRLTVKTISLPQYRI